MKKQLRRDNEKKRLDVVRDDGPDAPICDVSASLDAPDRVTPERQANAPLPSKPTFNANAKERLSQFQSRPKFTSTAKTRPTSTGAKSRGPVSSGKAQHSRAPSNGSRPNGPQPAGIKRRNLPFARTEVQKKAGVARAILTSPRNDPPRGDKGECAFCGNKGRTMKNVISACLSRKYLTTRESYDSKIVSDIIYNEPTHVVSVFKDYLIFDDVSEFMKRLYTAKECAARLPKIYDYYDKYSKVFPNFVVVPEKKYMFKNIARKQRMIDNQQKDADRKKEDSQSRDPDQLFTPTIMKEMETPDSSSRQDTQLRSYIKAQPGEDCDRTDLAEMSLRGLVDKFIQKDSRSSIDLNVALEDFDVKVPPAPSPAAKKPQPQIVSKPVSTAATSAEGSGKHLRGKNDAPMAAPVRTTPAKPAINVRPSVLPTEVKSLTIKIDTHRRPPNQQRPDNSTRLKLATAPTSTEGKKSRNARTQSSKEDESAKKPTQSIPAHSGSRAPSAASTRTTNSIVRAQPVSTATKPAYGSIQTHGSARIEARSHSQDTAKRRPDIPLQSKLIASAHPCKASTPTPSRAKAAGDRRNEGTVGRTHASQPRARPASSLGRPSSAKTTAQSPRKATPTKGMPTGSVPSSARNMLPAKPHLQVRSPVVRPGSSAGMTSAPGKERERIVSPNVLKIDLESLNRKVAAAAGRRSQIQKKDGGGPQLALAGGKKFKSDYLNSLKANSNKQPSPRPAAKEQPRASPNQVAKQPQTKDIVAATLSYSKSLENLGSARTGAKEERKSRAGVQSGGEVRRLGTTGGKRAYYQQFLKTGGK